ncbi:hypothetical protein RchiOBHm_Chr3g0492151 [Rosa chinensis]|uniref:Uncharacterized protein n=1 Tax=Rosa chinensis TaxID=74649 RepID=A0A2P6RGF3_ROSCH|nr:hypothetical protein RchiOBHm_Chr3g0492151 [Rosa chinensis]
MQPRGSARWRDGGARGHGLQPWWIVVRPWWIAELVPCGKWCLGWALVLGPGYLGLCLFSVLFGLSLFIFGWFVSFSFCSVKSILCRVMVVAVDSGKRLELSSWFVAKTLIFFPAIQNLES